MNSSSKIQNENIDEYLKHITKAILQCVIDKMILFFFPTFAGFGSAVSKFIDTSFFVLAIGAASGMSAPINTLLHH